MTVPAFPPTGRRLVRRTLVRAASSVTMLVLLYYLLPLDDALDTAAITLLALGLLAFVALATWQVRTILRSDHPALRAAEALALTISLFLVLFATTYFLMARATPGTFSEDLTRTDALYFTITVFATVGFGDIVPVSETARAVVTVQMIADLLVLGLLIRAVLLAVDTGRQRKTAPPETLDDTAAPPRRSP